MRGNIELPSSSSSSAEVNGYAAFDELSFDKDELVSIDDFMFMFPHVVNYPEIDYRVVDGVIGLNRYGFGNKDRFGLTHGMQGKTNAMRALIQDAILYNQTVKLDLNPK